MKRITVLLILALVLSACIPGNPIPEVLDSYYNPYNRTLASDGDYIFFCDAAGIYKMPVNGGGVQQLVSPDNNMPTFHFGGLTLHKETIYYINYDSGTLCKTDKEGGKPTTINADTGSINHIQCFQDTLYIYSRDKGLLTANIKSDPDELELNITHGRYVYPDGNFAYPTARGTFYKIIDHYDPESKIYIGALYHMDANNTQKSLIIDNVDQYQNFSFVVSERYIFYTKESAIWRCEPDGQNHQKMLDIAEDQNQIYQFSNYDTDWVYGHVKRGMNTTVFRMNQSTGEIEEYPDWPSYMEGFEVLDGYLYGVDKTNYRKIRMKVTGGDVEYSPFH